MQDAYQRILEYDPVWMILQPSLAVLLCDIAESTKQVPDSLRYIEFTGEYLDVGVRKRVETIFKCKTANQYGTKEVNSIAYECSCGTLHCMSGNVYMEILDETGNVAEVIAEQFSMRLGVEVETKIEWSEEILGI